MSQTEDFSGFGGIPIKFVAAEAGFLPSEPFTFFADMMSGVGGLWTDCACVKFGAEGPRAAIAGTAMSSMTLWNAGLFGVSSVPNIAYSEQEMTQRHVEKTKKQEVVGILGSHWTEIRQFDPRSRTHSCFRSLAICRWTSGLPLPSPVSAKNGKAWCGAPVPSKVL